MILSLNDVLTGAGLSAVRKLQTGSELLLALEINRVMQTLTGDVVSAECCTIEEDLLGQPYLNHCITNGLMMKEEYVASKTDATARNFFNSDITKVEWVEQSTEYWEYSHEVSFNNRMLILDGVYNGRGYVALMAYVIVHNYLNNARVCLRIRQGGEAEYEYAELIILQVHGNKLLASDKVLDLHYEDNNAIWEAYQLEHKQRGLMSREYSPTEKYKYCAKLYDVGDIVLRYERKKGGKTARNPRLASCYPAVIEEISTRGLKLKYYPMTETKLTRLRHLEQLKNSMYNITDRETFPVCTDDFEWRNVGIGGMTYDEKVFLLPVSRDDCGTYQVLTDGEVEEQIYLDAAETVYAVFRDRNIPCNIDKFKKNVFGNKVPEYDKYKVRMENNK